MDALTPELALVDPELAADARRRLPDPPDCLAVRPRPGVDVEDSAPDVVGGARPRRTWPSGGSAQTPLAAPAGNAAAGAVLRSVPSVVPPRPLRAPVASPPVVVEEPRRARPSLLAIVLVLLVALGIGLPSLDLVPWTSAELPSFARDDEGGATTGLAAEEGVVLEWPEAEGATVYDVVLWRGGRRLLDLWPETNRLDVRAAAAKAGKRLEPGTYQWFAFAGYGSRDDLRFGDPLANGTFTVE